MNNKQYLVTCSRCNPRDEKKPHIVYQTSRKRGVKLRCLNCGHFKQRYCNLNNLQSNDTTKLRRSSNE